MSRSPKLRHRPSRSVPASIVSILLLAAGVLLIWAGVVRLTQGSWPPPVDALPELLSATTWATPGWIAACVLAGLFGVALVVAAIKPGAMNAAVIRPNSVESGDVPSELVISRRAIARLAAARAEHLDGVESVRVSATAKRVRLQVWTPSGARDEIGKRISEHVRAELVSAGLHPVPKVSTTVHTKAQ